LIHRNYIGSQSAKASLDERVRTCSVSEKKKRQKRFSASEGYVDVVYRRRSTQGRPLDLAPAGSCQNGLSNLLT
jgi:hypothetical protein